MRLPTSSTVRRRAGVLTTVAVVAASGLAGASPASASPVDAVTPAAARSDHGPSGTRTVCAQSVQVRDTPIGSAHGILYRGDRITVTQWQYSSTTGRWWAYGATSVSTVSPGWVPEMYLSPNC